MTEARISTTQDERSPLPGRRGPVGTLPGRAAALAILAAISCLYLYLALSGLSRNVSDPERSKAFTSRDSALYLEMAEDFASGRFLHRFPIYGAPNKQFLYPALLSIALKVGGGNLMLLGMVNVLIGLFTIPLIYVIVARLFRSRLAALICAACYLTSGSLLSIITETLLTEPLYSFLLLLVICFFLLYVVRRASLHLYLGAAAAGLAYLARPNGLFLAGAAATTILLDELLLPAQGRFLSRAVLVRFAAAGLIFLAVTVPSWAPRLARWGNPIYHGYLTNMLWTDTLEEAKEIRKPTLGPSDYFATHSLGDALARLGFGLRFVFVRAAWRYDRILYLLAVPGLITALAGRRREHLLFLLLILLVMAPLVWTALPNPEDRLYGSALFPFSLILVAILVSSVERRVYGRVPSPADHSPP